MSRFGGSGYSSVPLIDGDYENYTNPDSQIKMTSIHRTGPNAEISDNISALTKQNAKLERMLAKIGTKADTQDFRDSINKEQKTATNLVKQIMQLFKQNSQGDRQVVQSLRSQFDVEYQRYDAAMEAIDSKQTQVLVAASKRENSALTPQIERLAREHRETHSHSHSSNNQYLMQQDQLLAEEDIQFVEYTADEVSRRHQQIKQLERDVLEVAEMYKDLALLVNEQQESIDIIDNNIQQTRDQTEAAHKQLLEAEELQRKARMRKCCALFLLIIIVAIIVILIVVLKKI